LSTLTAMYYDIKTLEKFVRSKRNGQIDKEMEKWVEQDSSLSYIVRGIEKHLDEQEANSNLEGFLKRKQDKIWKSLESVQADASLNSFAKSPASIPFWKKTFDKTLRYFKGEVDIHSYHYLMGFNCCCLLVLIVTCIWVGYLEGDINMINQGEIFDTKQ